MSVIIHITRHDCRATTTAYLPYNPSHQCGAPSCRDAVPGTIKKQERGVKKNVGAKLFSKEGKEFDFDFNRRRYASLAWSGRVAQGVYTYTVCARKHVEEEDAGHAGP